MNTVTLNMTDLMTDEKVSRTIDIVNAMSNGQECWELRNETEQRKNLENWISDRGNEQHNTILMLNTWTLNR